jgi:hypothetical protein
MKKKLMLGLWRFMLQAPPFLWEKEILAAKRKFEKELAFMTGEHRQIHHFIVRELPGHAKPMTADFIAEQTQLPVERVSSLLKDLDEHMTFICRNRAGQVVWAYPVTIEKTPHQVTFATGEQIYAA